MVPGKKDIGRMIRSAMRQQKRHGIEIIQLNFGCEVNPLNKHRWFCPGGFCDPLGAMVLTYQPRPSATDYKTVYSLFAKFGKNKKWVKSFAAGMNGDRYKTELNLRAHRLGQKIRNEFRLWK